MSAGTLEPSVSQTESQEQPLSARQPVYVQIVFGKLESSPAGDHRADGRDLVQQCVQQLDQEIFPAKLFVLWSTNQFAPYAELLHGVNEELTAHGLEKVPLIGTSAAAVWFDKQVHEQGVVLICIASRWIEARASIATDVRLAPTKATVQFFSGLSSDLERAVNRNINANGNRYLMMYVPGHSDDLDPAKYCGPEIVEEINRLSYGRLHVFGGVSSAGMLAGDGYQFCGSQVLQNAIVGALVTSDVAYGTGLNQGFDPVNQSVSVKEICSETGRVKTVKVGDRIRDAREWLSELQERYGTVVCTVPNRRGNRQTYVPSIVGESVRFHQPVPVDVPLQVMAPSSKALEKSVQQLRKRVIGLFDIDRSKVAGILAIGSVSRFRFRHKIGFDVEAGLRISRPRFPNSVHVGCYLDGEMGIDLLGHSVATNLSLSELLINDAIPSHNRNRLASEAIATFGPAASAAVTVHDAIRESLNCIDHAGFPGALISLVYRDKDTAWIKGQAAIGRRWIYDILPSTCRRFEGDDIIAIAARNPNEIHIVLDAQTDCRFNSEAARQGGVQSIAAIALLDERSEVLGILMVDLGDLRSKPSSDDLKVGLRILGVCVSRWVSGATQSEELRVARELDRLADSALEESSIDAATATFVCGALNVLDVSGHVRLWSCKDKMLSLVSGIGSYCESAKIHRPRIDLNDSSSTVAAFKNRKSQVINDSDTGPEAQPIRTRYSADHPIGALLRKYKSLANCVIKSRKQDALGVADDEPLGVITLVCEYPWYFTTARIRAVETIGRRLAEIIQHVTAIEAVAEKMAKLKYRNETSPPAWDDHPPLEALQSYMEQLCRANQAEVLSCFLWSSAQDRFVLRAQVGWGNPNWLHAAWFQIGEGMSGRLINQDEPIYVADRFDEHLELIPCKYIHEAFSDHVTGNPLWTYELLVFPLRFQKEKLGVVTMYRRRPKVFQLGTTGFTTIDKDALRDASQAMSAYVFGLTKADGDQWYALEWNRLQNVREKAGELLERNRDLGLSDVLSDLCGVIKTSYRVAKCAVFFTKDGDQSLTPVASASERSPSNDTSWGGQDILNAMSGPSPVVRRHPTGIRSRDPRIVRIENQVERVYLPLIASGGERIGVLAMHWNGAAHPTPDQPVPRHNETQLMDLAKIVADVVFKHVSARKEVRANESLLGMAGYLAIAMHEMRNKVQSLQSAIRLLSGGNFEAPGEERQYWDEAQKTITGLRKVFDDATRRGSLLTDAAKKEWCAIPSLIERAVEQSLSRKAVRCELEIISPPSASQMSFWVDAGQLVECFRNLISNAFRAVGDEGRVTVRVKVDENHGVCAVHIEDTGPGIPRGTFDDFSRGRFGSLKPQGSGLGLFISRLFCDANKSRLILERECNPTIVTVVLSGGRTSTC